MKDKTYTDVGLRWRASPSFAVVSRKMPNKRRNEIREIRVTL